MSNTTQINCPNCGTEININKALYSQLETEIKGKFDSEVQNHRQKYLQAIEALKRKELKIKHQETNFQSKLQEELAMRLVQEKSQLTFSIKEELETAQKERIDLMERELEEKSMQLIELNRSKAQVEQLKREKDELSEKIKFETQKELNTLLDQERQKIHKLVHVQNELKFKEKEKQLSDLKQKLEEARQKAEQGSQQSQGEIQELAIESWLEKHFPFDTIEEIKKGARGADCIQTVNTRELPNCGTIYYESKRTKDFHKSWIEKFKVDIREKGADIGVLITETLPKDLERMSLVDGIWICTYDEFKALSYVLREHIVKLSHFMQSQENKSDKMSILYGYLTSTEFSMQIEAIVEGFTQMQSDLESEKRALARIWKQREKQIQKVLDNTTGMYGSVRGIAGSSVKSIQALELPYAEKEETA